MCSPGPLCENHSCAIVYQDDEETPDCKSTRRPLPLDTKASRRPLPLPPSEHNQRVSAPLEVFEHSSLQLRQAEAEIERLSAEATLYPEQIVSLIEKVAPLTLCLFIASTLLSHTHTHTHTHTHMFPISRPLPALAGGGSCLLRVCT